VNDVLDFINVVGVVALAVWLVVRVRRWARSDAGRERLLAWSPATIITAQTLVVILWLTAVVTSPWSFYHLYMSLGGWSILPIRLMVAAVLILIPCGIIFCDAAWLRLHQIPIGWTLPRIWATGIIVFLAAAAMFAIFKGLPAMTIFVIITFANLLTTVFLTVWWFFSHPLPAK
jgi:hypothetical protein